MCVKSLDRDKSYGSGLSQLLSGFVFVKERWCNSGVGLHNPSPNSAVSKRDTGLALPLS